MGFWPDRARLALSRFLRVSSFGFAALIASSSSSHALTNVPIYRNPFVPVDERVNDILHKMSLDEKISMLSGITSGSLAGFSTPAIPRLGIPAIKMNDGPLGVRYGNATSFPSGILMGASFDPDLETQVAQAIAQETRGVGHDMLLGPCIGISRQPFGGRNFESFGEDPYLTSQMAVHYVHGLQGEGVIGSTKHFALNDQEYHRTTINTIADERTMQEIHLPAFHAAVEAGTWSIMASYNLINGLHATENPDLLTRILKKDWDYQGFVISDWSATHSTVAAANAGLDLEMPFGLYFGSPLMDAVQSGEVDQPTIDDKVARILRAIFGSGLYDRSAADNPDPSQVGSPEHLALAQKAAASGLVLLKNENSALPIHEEKVHTIAMIGPGGKYPRTGGGGSSLVNPTRVISPLSALRERLNGKPVQVKYAPGFQMNGDFEAVSPSLWMIDPHSQAPGVTAEYFDNQDLSGAPVVTRIEPTIDADWKWGSPDSKIPTTHFSARWTGYIRATATGTYTFSLRVDDGGRLYVDDKLVINSWHDQAASTYTADLAMVAGHTYKIRVEYYQDGGDDTVALGLQPRDAQTDQDLAVYLAKNSDVAVIFAGLSSSYEGEGQDRSGLGLPKGQDELISAVAKVNPRTVVVINGGNPVLMPWLNQVQGVLYAWYGGQEAGYAIADALLGTVNPSGKLPVTFPKKWEDEPAYGAYPTDPGTSDQVTYKEGIYVGYRWFDTRNVEPLFPFGFGLSYTQFAFSNLKVNSRNLSTASPNVDVSFDVTNTGAVAGAEVAQLYVSEAKPPIDRPMQELKGFKKVFLQPGEKQSVTLHLDRGSFAYFDPAKNAWTVAPDRFTVRVGSSSRDIKLMQSLTLK